MQAPIVCHVTVDYEWFNGGLICRKCGGMRNRSPLTRGDPRTREAGQGKAFYFLRIPSLSRDYRVIRLGWRGLIVRMFDHAAQLKANYPFIWKIETDGGADMDRLTESENQSADQRMKCQVDGFCGYRVMNVMPSAHNS
jgi:hypothetical protein